MNAKKRILVVDDEPSITRNLKLNLEANGEYEVHTENLATRALAAARKFRPDLILLDVVMPDMEGGDLAAQIKGDPLFQKTPIIFLTALISNTETEGDKMASGTQLFLAKPVSIEKLKQVIEQYTR